MYANLKHEDYRIDANSAFVPLICWGSQPGVHNVGSMDSQNSLDISQGPMKLDGKKHYVFILTDL